MADGISIQLNVDDVQRAVSAMNQLASATGAVDRHSRLVGGPFQRLDRARESAARAAATGNVSAARDAQFAQQRALRQIERFERRGIRAAEMLEQISPELVALGGAALVAIAGLNHLTAELTAFNTSRFLTGGTTGQSARLSAVFGAAGVGDFGGAASHFRERLAGSPRAQAAFGRSVLPRDVDPGFNEAQLMEQAIAKIMDPLTTMEEKRRLILLGELEALAPLLEVYPAHRAELEKEARLKERLADPQAVYNAQEFQYQMNNLGSAFSELGQAAGQFLIPGLNFLSEALTEAARGWALMLDALAGLLGFKSGKGQSTQDKHTAAVNDNTDALRAMNKEFANGGPRAAGAVPRGLHGNALEQALQHHSIRGGAFAL